MREPARDIDFYQAWLSASLAIRSPLCTWDLAGEIVALLVPYLRVLSQHKITKEIGASQAMVQARIFPLARPAVLLKGPPLRPQCVLPLWHMSFSKRGLRGARCGLTKINVEFLQTGYVRRSVVPLGMESVMVEKSHTAGAWPHLYEPLRGLGQKVADWFAPRSEASAMADHYEIKVELPGVAAENVDVSVHDNNLTVCGKKQSEHEETGRDFFFSEREYGAFQRTFRLPPDAASDKIDAEFKDGVLSLRVAKQKPTEIASRKVNIRQA